jgi:hypothetical protein
MNRFKFLVVLATIMVCALPAMAQQKRISPKDTNSVVIDGNKLTVVYSRPYTKDPKSGEVRKIWGGLVPFGKVWRTGANEATLFTTEKPITLGGADIPAGTYSIYTLPADADSAKLIVNKQTGQWGTVYDEKQDLVRIDLKKAALDKTVDQFTMTVEKGSSGGVLKLAWEKTEFSAPIGAAK